MWGLAVGILSYFPFAWYAHRYLDERGFPPGFSRKLTVFIIASILSTAAGYGVSWLTTSAAQRQQQSALETHGLSLSQQALAACSTDADSPACQQKQAAAKQWATQMLGHFLAEPANAHH